MIAELEGEVRAWFRVMMRDDLRDVLRIEAEAFEFPWSEADFIEHLEDPDSVALVVECDAGILSYVVFGLGEECIQIFSCVVSGPARRKGVGTDMVSSLLGTAAARRRRGVMAKVPERNVAAQMFFRSCGFRALETLPGYLLDGQDVYVMAYSMPGVRRHAGSSVGSDDELVPLWEVKHS